MRFHRRGKIEQPLHAFLHPVYLFHDVLQVRFLLVCSGAVSALASNIATCAAARIDDSGLPIPCATAAAISPTAAMRWDATNSDCILSRFSCCSSICFAAWRTIANKEIYSSAPPPRVHQQHHHACPADIAKQDVRPFIGFDHAQELFAVSEKSAHRFQWHCRSGFDRKYSQPLLTGSYPR